MTVELNDAKEIITMLPNKKPLAAGLINFQTLSGINGFSFDAFEKKAEELEVKYPGEGYQRAYNETLTQMFRTRLVDKYLREESTLLTLSELVEYFDTYLMKKYVDECKKQGVSVSIKLNDNGFNIETLQSFNAVLDSVPATVLNEVAKKFDSGELTLDSTYKYTKDNAQKVPSRKEARELVAYATFLEQRNEDRSVLQTLLNLITHIREKFAVKAMRELAAKCDKISVLEAESENEYYKLAQLRNEVDYRLINAQATNEHELDFERLQQVDGENLDNYLENVEFSRIANVNDNELDTTLELDEIDASFSIDDTAIKKMPFSDESIIESNDSFSIDDDDRMSISFDDLLNDPEDINNSMDIATLDEAKTATDKFNGLKESDAFREEVIGVIVNMIGNPSFTDQDKHDWAEFYVFDDMMKEAGLLCELYDEAIGNENSSAKIESIIQNGVNKLYETAYGGLGGMVAYDSCTDGIALEERPVLAQKLTDLFLNKVTPVGFNSKEFGKYAENYVIKNGDYAIKVMQEQEENLGKEKCTELVNNAEKELHAFDKVEFKASEFDNSPKNVGQSEVHVSDPVVEKSASK